MLQLIRLIDRNPEKHFDVNHQARKMNMTSAHLRRLFNLFVGCSPLNYVNRSRMARAAEFLRKTDRPIKQITNEVGIEDVYYYTKLFSKHHGQPPAAYRRTHQRLAES